jgi:DNA-binding transcriptional LysR family regulator
MFIKVAELLNFSAAAKSMYITQPALSKSIGRLEENLGSKLFRRSSHGVRLTDSGKYLYAELSPPIRKIHKVISDMQNIGGAIRRRLVIGCHNAFYESGMFTKLKDMIREYEAENSDVTLLIELAEYPQLNEMLISGEVDVIISISNFVTSAASVSTKFVGRAEYFLVMSADHPLAASDEIDFLQLKDEVFYFIATDDKNSASGEMARFKPLGFMPKSMYGLPNFHSVMMAIAMGRGMTLSGYFDTEKSTSRLKFFPLPETYNSHDIVVAWRTDDISPPTRAFLDMFHV